MRQAIVFFIPVLFLGTGCVNTSLGPEDADLQVTLSRISPYVSAGVDGRFNIDIVSPSGKGLTGSMLDRSCFKVRLENGEVLSPPDEGVGERLSYLGTGASIGRTVNLGDTLEGLKTQTVEVWWSHGEKESEKLSVRLYEWDLEAIEAVIETDKGEMTAVFFPGKAPITVTNFVDLCLKGFYDGLTFHRVIPGFMIQGGCPHGDGTGDPGYTIKGEFTDIKHEKGILSMARSEDPDSGGCQFFVMHDENTGLDGLYAAFGKVVSGQDTVDRIANVQTRNQRFSEENSRPVEPPRIKKITIRPRADREEKN